MAATITQLASTADCAHITAGLSAPSQRNASTLLPKITVDSNTQSSTSPSCQ